jgi:hypothetical protein
MHLRSAQSRNQRASMVWTLPSQQSGGVHIHPDMTAFAPLPVLTGAAPVVALSVSIEASTGGTRNVCFRRHVHQCRYSKLSAEVGFSYLSPWRRVAEEHPNARAPASPRRIRPSFRTRSLKSLGP